MNGRKSSRAFFLSFLSTLIQSRYRSIVIFIGYCLSQRSLFGKIIFISKQTVTTATPLWPARACQSAQTCRRLSAPHSLTRWTSTPPSTVNATLRANEPQPPISPHPISASDKYVFTHIRSVTRCGEISPFWPKFN